MTLNNLLHYRWAQELKYHLHPLYWKLIGRRGIYKAFTFVPKDIKMIVDVGAADGDYAREMLREFPKAKIFCFEPIPESYNKITRKLEQHYPHREFKIYNVALSDQKDIARLKFDSTHPDAGTLIPGEHRGNVIEVKTDTMDNLLEKVSSIDFMKIDVEGWERRVLAGGKNTMRKVKYLYIETSFGYGGGRHFFDVIADVGALGFLPVFMSEDHNMLFQYNC